MCYTVYMLTFYTWLHTVYTVTSTLFIWLHCYTLYIMYIHCIHDYMYYVITMSSAQLYDITASNDSDSILNTMFMAASNISKHQTCLIDDRNKLTLPQKFYLGLWHFGFFCFMYDLLLYADTLSICKANTANRPELICILFSLLVYVYVAAT